MFKRVVTSLAFLGMGFCNSAAAKSPKDDRVVLTKNNVLVMDTQFTRESVAKVAVRARELNAKLGAGEPIYLVMNTPGGEIDAGLELIDNLNALDRPVHTVNLFSASMGFITAMSLGTRYVSPSGTLMSHKAKGGFSGEFPGQLDSRYQYYLRRVLAIDEVVAARSGGKLTVATYQAMYENELWCDAQDCVNIGVADKVVRVQCDQSLNGTSTVENKISFFGKEVKIAVVKANCPTITGMLDLNISVDGKKLNRMDLVNLDRVAVLLNLSPKGAVDFVTLVESQVALMFPAEVLRLQRK